MLLAEAKRKDPHSTDFLESLQGVLPALAPGDRNSFSGGGLVEYGYRGNSSFVYRCRLCVALYSVANMNKFSTGKWVICWKPFWTGSRGVGAKRRILFQVCDATGVPIDATRTVTQTLVAPFNFRSLRSIAQVCVDRKAIIGT